MGGCYLPTNVNEIMTPSVEISFAWTKKQIKLFFKFGLVGVIAAVIDIVLFNALVGLVQVPPISGKIISGVLSTLFAWAGNRSWTFRNQRRANKVSEVIEYFLVAIGGLLISLTCLWLSHYVLGFESLLADNISGNVVGLSLATMFRFFGNQYWVFNSTRQHSKVDQN